MPDFHLSDYDWRKGLILLAILTVCFAIQSFFNNVIDRTHGLLFASLSAVFLIVLYVRRDAFSLRLVGILSLILVAELVVLVALPLPRNILGFSAVPVSFADLFLLLRVASKVKPER